MRSLRPALALLILHAFNGGVCAAQSPGVPALPTTNAAYVDYAVNNLPNYFRAGTDVGDTDNTPANNPITDPGATLGRVLFYDNRLSHNDSISCSSCHKQENGFSDPEQFSVGFEGGLTGRHSMGLSNAKFYNNGRFFWDERADTLEDQVLGPIQDSVEMGTDLNQLREELAATEFYPTLFANAYDGSTEITNDKVANALAQFVRSMASYQSKFDTARAQGEVGSPAFNSQLTALERQGSALFHGAGKCSQCHGTDAHIGDAPRNIGLDLTNDADVGVVNGRFKVPSLRNIGVRDGFMHDGRFDTLEAVIDFYSTGIQDNPNLDNRLQVNGNPIQFNFTQNEKDALIAYLNALTDDTFLTSELFSDPFVDLPGDFDGSGLVDAADLQFWQDNSMDGASFLQWQTNLGQSWQDLSIGASLAAVPEPTTGLLATLAAVFALGRRRRGWP
ncbi:MAG: cytochrome c peroxidase [Planctomycetota bacterium]